MPPFFDTNVLVYAFDEAAPEKRAIALDLIEEHLIQGNVVEEWVFGRVSRD